MNMPPPQFPGQPYPGQQALPPPGFIRVHAKHNVMMSMVPPTLTIDGLPVQMNKGEQVIPVVPGNHLVTGHGQWMWQYGRAELPVSVAQGHTVDVFYALPMITFMKGAIGFQPVKAPGKLALFLLLAAILAIPIILILAGVLAS